MRAPLAFAALAALVTAACAPTLAAPGEDSRFLADFPECPYEWLTMVEGSSRASLYMAAVREGGDAVVDAHENRRGNRTWRSTSEPRWQGSAIKLLDPTCQLAQSPLEAQQLPAEEAIAKAIEITIDLIRRANNFAQDEAIAIDVRPVPLPLSPIRSSASLVSAETMQRVAGRMNAPTGTVEGMTRCSRHLERHCEVVGAGGIVGVGRVSVREGQAQLEVRTWYPSYVSPEQLGGSAWLVTLEWSEPTWDLVKYEPLAPGPGHLRGAHPEGPPEQDLRLMEAAMEAMVDHLRRQRSGRPVVADTFGFGMPFESGPDWRAQGGPQWMAAIAGRLDLPLGGSADPAGQILLSVLPPRDGPPEGDTVRIPARASVRIRDLDTGEFTDRVNVNHWDVALVRDPGGWRVEEIVLTAIASGTRIEDRERWWKGLKPEWW